MTFRIEITDDHVHVFEQRVRRLKDEDTGEVVEVPDTGHSSAIGLGDFATRDPKTGEVISVDTDAFNAAVQAKIVAVCGKDLANVIAAKAEATAIAAASAPADRA